MKATTFNDAVKEFVQKYDIVNQLAVTHGMARDIVYRSMLNNSFSFIFGDVVNSFMRDCENDLCRIGKGFSAKTKYSYNQMMKCIKGARKWSDEMTKPMYASEQVDSLCHDSDFWYALIRLIEDRIGTDKQKTNLLIEFLLNMPESDGPYKVSLNDFKNI